ncbi:MAG: hypothetical protein ACLTY5_04590 [Angelakisella sp.]
MADRSDRRGLPSRRPGSRAGPPTLRSVLSQWRGISVHRTIGQNRQQLSAVMPDKFGPLPYTRAPLPGGGRFPAAASCSRLGCYYLDGEALGRSHHPASPHLVPPGTAAVITPSFDQALLVPAASPCMCQAKAAKNW